MAKIAAAPTAAPAPESAPKSGKKKWIVAAAVGLLALVGGAVTPMFAHFGAHAETGDQEASAKHDPRNSLIPFDSIVVNIEDGRYTRYLRVKITLVVEARDEKLVKELVEREKQFLQTWVLGYLQDRKLEQLHGSVGMNRVRREIRGEFNQRLFPDGPEKIKDILLPEYNFQ
jgi:flagellar basal body-associated protein FliL